MKEHHPDDTIFIVDQATQREGVAWRKEARTGVKKDISALSGEGMGVEAGRGVNKDRLGVRKKKKNRIYFC